MRNAIAITLCLIFVSCQQMPVKQMPETQGYALPWGHADWDKELRAQVKAQLPKFEQADWSEYCPNFNHLTDQGKIDAIATMFVAVAKFECDWDARSSAIDVGDTYSTGLFQLSKEDEFSWCDMSSNDVLKDPINNIDCAIPEAAKLIGQNGVVAEGGRSEFLAHEAKGMSRYWSTMWPSAGSKGEGHKEEIISMSKRSPGCM